jgi:beta-glucosidase
MVETDYDGSYGYMISDHCVRSGNDLLLGFNYQDTNVFTDTDSATLVLAMRQACKNILYTVGNSGAYTKTDDSSGLEPMTKMFLIIDIVVAVVLIAVEVILVIACRKKLRKNRVY